VVVCVRVDGHVRMLRATQRESTSATTDARAEAPAVLRHPLWADHKLAAIPLPAMVTGTVVTNSPRCSCFGGCFCTPVGLKHQDSP
jgi:hypothetical protein